MHFIGNIRSFPDIVSENSFNSYEIADCRRCELSIRWQLNSIGRKTKDVSCHFFDSIFSEYLLRFRMMRCRWLIEHENSILQSQTHRFALKYYNVLGGCDVILFLSAKVPVPPHQIIMIVFTHCHRSNGLNANICATLFDMVEPTQNHHKITKVQNADVGCTIHNAFDDNIVDAWS